MKIYLTASGKAETIDSGYALRLIEQGLAVPADQDKAVPETREAEEKAVPDKKPEKKGK